jgi:hypothetical protein
MGIVSQGVECLSGQSREQRVPQRCEEGFKTPEVPRGQEKRDTCPSLSGASSLHRHARPPEGAEAPVMASTTTAWENSEGS